jgi:homoprotocatechuate degradation regulator HpaR
VISRFRPILNAHGLTEQQWRIVRALLDAGPLEPRQIGELCRISSPSLAGVLARMDDMGLVKRETMAEDQRRVLVRLTPRAQRLVARIGALAEARYRALEDAIGVDVLHEVYDHLDRLIDHLGRAEVPADETPAPAPRGRRT